MLNFNLKSSAWDPFSSFSISLAKAVTSHDIIFTICLFRMLVGGN